MIRSKVKILVLNVHKKDGRSMNDFADFNAMRLMESFGGGRVFYFSDSVNNIGIRRTEEEIRRIIAEEGVSIVFFAPNGDSYELSIEFFKGLKKDLGVKCVLWVLDDEMIFDVMSKYYSQAFDAAVTTDYYATFAYRKLGLPALYYFSSYLKADLHPVDVERDIPVSFIGDCAKADRMEYINYLRENGVDARSFGDGSEKGFLSKAEVPAIYSRSKINLNFTKVDHAGPGSWFLADNALTNIIRQNKGRPMEIALTRSFCLSETSPSIGVVFEQGKEIDTFRCKEELLAKVNQYLKNDGVRERIAEGAYRKAVSEYEAGVFFPALADRLCAVLDEGRYLPECECIHKDPVFKKNQMIRLSIVMLYQMSRLKALPAAETFKELFRYGIIVFLSSFIRAIKISFLKLVHKKRSRRHGLQK
ncbi:MAG: glycosyltransferase family 1 protein [Deltaproteobacteria bacterium]|nr:glycosyltransferase family 1 protein [Deltaproteobacteria bacterium]